MKTSVVVAVLVIVALLVVAPVAEAQGGDKGELPNLLEVISPSLQTLIEALVAAVIPYLVYHVKCYLDEVTKQARQMLTSEQYALLEAVVRNLVHAAQQIYGEMDGDRKKEYVLRQAQEAMARYGLELDVVNLEALIESMVRQELKAPAIR